MKLWKIPEAFWIVTGIRPPAPTWRRWVVTGLKNPIPGGERIRLDVIKLGGKLHVTEESVREFLAATSLTTARPELSMRDTAENSISVAEQLLDREIGEIRK